MCLKLLFCMQYRHYEFIGTPFGLTNTDVVLMDLINRVFQPYLNQFVIVLIDDMLVYSKSREKHEKHLNVILQTL